MIFVCVKNGEEQGLTREAEAPLVKKPDGFFLAAAPGLWSLRDRRVSLCFTWRKT